MILYLLALVCAIVLIAKAGDTFVDSARGIARALRVPQALVALTLMAFATSAPELFTSTIASGLGDVGISYGNIVGSNIVNISLILALAAIFGTAKIERERLDEGIIMLVIGVALTAMALNEKVDWMEGLLLLLIFVLFMKFELKKGAHRRIKRKLVQRHNGLRRLITLFILGTAGIIIGSRLLIYSGVGVAQDIGISEAVIGFTLVAVGTSIPELATIVISIHKKLPEIAVGTIVGSSIFNVALILGCAALINPLTVTGPILWFSNTMMLAVMALLLAFMWRGRLGRGEGAVLLSLYTFYLVGLAII